MLVSGNHIVNKIGHTHGDAVEYNLGKVMGLVAFERGIYAACNDPEAMAHLSGRKVGTSAYFLRGWVAGNAQARLAG